MEYIIGVDIGTTSVKVILFNTKGEIVSYANKGYTTYHDTPDTAEEDPEEIFQAMLEGLSDVVKESKISRSALKGVSFSSAMHSVILLDKNHQPLTRAIIWADNRAVKEVEKLKKDGMAEKLYSQTGTPIHPMTPLAKILWIKNNKPELFKKTRWFVGIKEYIIYKLFGQLKEDYSIANATGMFNLFKMDWDDLALKLTDVKRDQLPELVNTTYQLTGLKKEYANQVNIDPKVPFIIGASDGTLANLGVGAVDAGNTAVTIGTSGAVRTTNNVPKLDPKGRTFCYYLYKNMWVLGGPVNNGGSVFHWVRDNLCGPETLTAREMKINPYELLTDIAATVPVGSNGLIFLPFLDGERAPLWDANARGTYFGLNSTHTRADMIRAALEGVMYNLYTVMLVLESVVGIPPMIRATGGFAHSSVWRQMLADVFENDINISNNVDGTALGAAILGMYSLGIINSLQEAKKLVGKTTKVTPIPKNYKIYRQLIPIYINLTKNLQPEFTSIAQFQREHAPKKSNNA